jgi:NAD(P)-dependent dehydrogenase (short-subunit alcohol dehydrogenase family)
VPDEPRTTDHPQDFVGRTVVVVGADGALGRGLVAAFLARGADVRGLARTPPDAPVPGARYDAVDVLDDRALGACFDAEPAPWAVVNVVGGFAGARPLTELDPAELSTQLQLNLTSAALVTKHALRRMAGGGGRIVHTASRSALDPAGSGLAYSVSKAGVLHLVRMAAAETHGTGITVNAVVPSIMDTPANRAAMPSADPSGWPSVEDVAEVYVFLASPAAGLVSGAAIPVYGAT